MIDKRLTRKKFHLEFASIRPASGLITDKLPILVIRLDQERKGAVSEKHPHDNRDICRD